MSFADTFNALLEERGMSQADFARASGWQTSYVSQVARGKVKDPSLSRAMTVARVLGVTLQDLYDRSFGTDSCSE